ncbi:dihydrodipicolinate synthase family protein [Frondihabitans sp. PAMC 28766]|uniref:dihydrodipicolinate synthase family protein n=1 Tax=Frondihabitans sp. PAMC 28766 TaxID=1795630 RepID=UPI00078CACED|nr:dihydrodipicolinate synthase family protein [Frondihabitans sp. PAMC 28766]AMM20178.1 dihydrodipicolinate synthase family protein [Frondihabitans sp. PAMC 28766]
MTSSHDQILSGIVPPLCTPLTPSGEIDTTSLVRLAEHLLTGGVDGLFVLGSTGEVAFLTDEQRGIVIETVVHAVRGRVPVVAGVIDTTTPRVIPHLEQAAALGATAAVATAPFYTRTHPAEIEKHFRLLASATELPIVAYDIPVSVGTKLDAGLVTRLAQDRVIRAVKDSSGDDTGLRQLILSTSEAETEDFAILTGSELTVDAALSFGADGAVPGLGNVDPAGYVRLFEAARADDWDGARAEQERLFALFGLAKAGDTSRMGAASSALGAFKAALHLLGVIDCPRVSDPYIPLDAAETAIVAAHLEKADLL